MYAVFVQVDADESLLEQARKRLQVIVVPLAREAGATAGYWLAPHNSCGVSITVFEQEESARAHASLLTVGQPVGVVDGVTVRAVEIREVIAHL